MNRSVRFGFGSLLVIGLAGAGVAPKGRAQSAPKPTIVLVHGAFADGNSWGKVIPILVKDGYRVVAVQNPLTGLTDDVANTKRVVESQPGPVVLVGHSYGGMVITDAAAGNANVKSLVYIAAYAPETGEKIGELNAKYPQPALGSAIVADKGGYLSIDPAKFHSVFCPDVSQSEALVMAVTQKPINSISFGQSTTAAAWHSIPTWYQVSEDDQAINPDLERWMAKRMNAKTTSLKASHVAMISKPAAIAKMIEEAAQ